MIDRLEQARHRSRDIFLGKIEKAKECIEREAEANGVYPGKLNLATFAKLAGIGADALHHPNHRDTTKKDVVAFLDALTARRPAPVICPRGGKVGDPNKERVYRLEQEVQRLAEEVAIAKAQAATAEARARAAVEAEMTRLRARVAELEGQVDQPSPSDGTMSFPKKPRSVPVSRRD